MTLAEDIKLQETPKSSKNVVIVMDGMQEFTTEPLEWALKIVIEEGCIVTLLGIMPWLNIPRKFSSKTWLDVWMLKLKDLLLIKEKSELRSDVVPQKEVVMGYPLRLLVVEQITGLHATWVVFDR
ncbi:hypothetical protein CMV_008689 [Castanea mollissima]|uniref:Uncharacterized protein n=1 Tax=Castanea mollissima TaxID=60419 RepID=A0A8J4RLF3_9ROSI|nr:hypothetical protein CMV_008689 [Castanea mollissima]